MPWEFRPRGIFFFWPYLREFPCGDGLRAQAPREFTAARRRALAILRVSRIAWRWENGPMSKTLGPRQSATPDETPATAVRGGGVPLFSFGPWFWASLCVLLTSWLVLTGLGLSFFYTPGPGSAESLADLEHASGFGFLRDLHFWAGHGLVLAAWLHLARVFVVGSYRRRLGWRVTVALVVLVTCEMWLGDALGRGGEASTTAVYAAHVLMVPLLMAVLVAAWARARRRRDAITAAFTRAGEIPTAEIREVAE